MDITVRRAKEFTKGLLGGKGVKLSLEVVATLSEEENALIERYHDPFISVLDLKGYFKSEESFNLVKVNPRGANLSRFRLVAHVDNGLEYLGNIDTLEKAIVTELTDKLSYLKSLDKWEGEETITVG
jgi:hypothetical protein